MFRKVSANVLFVQDFEKSLVFYRDMLGLPVVQLEANFAAFKMDDQDFALNELSAGAEMVGLDVADFEAQTGKADRIMLCARVENVDAAYETLKARGVEFTKGPVDQYWGLRCAYFRDPDGNVWEIAQPLPPQQK